MSIFITRTIRACLVPVVLLAMPAHAQESPPLTLDQAITAALEGNPDLAVAAFELKAQRAHVRQEGLRPATEASLDAENFLVAGESGTAEWTLALSQVVELGSKRSARVASAEAGVGALESERQARQLDVLAEVTRRFIAVAAAQERKRLAKTALQLAEQTLEGSERRVRAAKSPHVELDRAHLALDRARLDERRAASDHASARRSLAALWGESDAVIGGRPFGEVSARLFDMPSVGEFSELAARLDGNPDFLKFASEARIRDAELRVASSLRSPDVTFGAGVRWFEETKDSAFVASLSLPLFSGARAQGAVAEAQANRERVDIERQGARVKARAALFGLHRQLDQAVFEVAALRDEMLPHMEEALEETRHAYDRGRYGYLELVDAQREYLSVQAALISAAADAHTLQAEIERLTNAPLTGAAR